MVNQSNALDNVFGALSSPVRRRTIEALESGARTASELAAPHDMTLPGFMKHLQVLTNAGLVSCVKDGRTVTCTLVDQSLSKASIWLSGREAAINAQLDALGRHLYHREQIESDAASFTKRRRKSK